jgi:hypothetical protein
MCRVAANKPFLHYFHILYTDIFKNKVLFSTFLVKMLEKNKKITKNQSFVWYSTEGFNPDAPNFNQHRV